jgi:hypothetical protein
MNSLVDPEVICRAVVAEGQQDRPAGVVTGGVDQAVLASLDQLEQPSASSASVTTTWTWVEVSSAEETSPSHVRRTRSPGHGHRDPRAGEVGRVVDPDRPWGVADPVGEWLTDAAPRPGQRPQPQPLRSEHAAHAGRRDPYPAEVAAAVGQLAVGAVDLAPLAEQRHDLGDLVGEQAVHGAAARRVVVELVSGGQAT